MGAGAWDERCDRTVLRGARAARLRAARRQVHRPSALRSGGWRRDESLGRRHRQGPPRSVTRRGRQGLFDHRRQGVVRPIGYGPRQRNGRDAARRTGVHRRCRPTAGDSAGLSRPATIKMNQVRNLDGNTFVVSDERGDIEASLTDPTGLFSFDTRFLSKWILTVSGQRLTALSVDDLHYFETQFFLVPGTGTVYVDSKLSVIRHRVVREGFHEQLTILNHQRDPVDLVVRIEADADFADLFEVKDAVPKRGTYSKRAEEQALVLAYRRETFARATVLSSSEPCAFDDDGLTFDIRIGPHGTWTTALQVAIDLDGPDNDVDGPSSPAWRARRPRTNIGQDLERWIQGAPRLECDSEPLKATYRRSLIDLAALRFSPLSAGRHTLPAAGLPWFMTMFGRDSIITSLQALPFTPDLAATTLRELALRQGTRNDDFRDEDPGRILHEMRYGEMTAFEERPHSPYYGSA